ncbi:class I SAM-dependent methyltransferase [Dactylosporangium sp. AC04546]|uniref:class I SAM-dependent methyltransferase n=1 Tax=Dactylosporangium sp. AC04546 TaxID=2862460 RepID=UPI001EDD597E|nr:class I SAM-dependent methyltransferase [Dactylosporangium sp. AC04546]WVK82638.1 class I SAM-dependent methyltransferase [Dactylosporangium sp. AC04546]
MDTPEGFRWNRDVLAHRDADDDIFQFIYDRNVWGSAESASGGGSELTQTRVLRVALPELFRRLGVTTLLDAPCGDFRWMQHIELGGIRYVGLDVVPKMIEANQARFGSPLRRFVAGDVVCEPLPDADVMLCRDCLVHLSYQQVFEALANIARSRIRYLLATTFVERAENHDIVTGDWRPLNLCAPPFNLPQPEQVIVEGCTENGGVFADKALGLWPTSALPV